MKFMTPLLLFFIAGYSNIAFSHSLDLSEAEKRLQTEIAESPSGSSVSGIAAVFINPNGKGIQLQYNNSNDVINLYKELSIEPKVVWSNDKKLFSLVLRGQRRQDRYLVVVDVSGNELFRHTVTQRVIDYGWVSSGNNQGLFINSSDNIVYPYHSSGHIGYKSTQRKDTSPQYRFSYDGENDEITIYKNNYEVRKIKGYIYDISFSPSQNYLLYGFGNGFSIYDFRKDTINFIEGGVEFSLSPNESKIAYISTKDNGHFLTDSDIYVYDLFNKTTKKVTKSKKKLERSPSWISDNTIRYSFYNSKSTQELNLEEQ